MTARRVPWLAVALAGAALLGWAGAWAVRAWGVSLPGCPTKALLGIPCATCGGTRCLLALTAGDLAGAFHWHPVLAGVLLLAPLAALWDLARAWRGRPYPPMPQGLGWRLGAFALVGVAWAVQLLRGI